MAQWLASLASNHRLSLLWVQVPQMALLRACPNMTLAVEWDVKTPNLTLPLYGGHRGIWALTIYRVGVIETTSL